MKFRKKFARSKNGNFRRTTLDAPYCANPHDYQRNPNPYILTNQSLDLRYISAAGSYSNFSDGLRKAGT